MWGPLSLILSTPTAVKVQGHDSWIHYSQVKLWKKTEEDTQYTYEALGDLRYIFKWVQTTNECHSNEHHQNQVSGDKMSQDSAKEPTQLDRGCTIKYSGDISPDPWTRRDLRYFKWDILNEKHSDPTGPQRMSWRVLGVATISHWGVLLLVRGNLELANCTHLTC